MSDTPETDAAFRKGMNGKQVYEFAEKLERERDEARNKMADALQEVDLRTLDFERMKEERDEAREALAEAWRFADQWLALADGYLKRINKIQNDIRKN